MEFDMNVIEKMKEIFDRVPDPEHTPKEFMYYYKLARYAITLEEFEKNKEEKLFFDFTN